MSQNLYVPPKAAVPVAFPSVILAGTTWNSPVIATPIIKSIIAGITLSQTGVITIQRYADQAGQVAVGAPITQALAANTAAWCGVADGLPFASVIVSVQNTGGVTANVTKTAALGNS